MSESDLDLLYIAGFFDGEGSVNIGLSSKSNKNGRHWWPVVRCIIANTNKEILERIHKTLELGTIQKPSKDYNKDVGKRRRPFYFVITSTDQVISFVDQIVPYSIVKKEELELAKKAALFIKKHSPKSRCNRWLKAKVQEYIEHFIDKNKAIKNTTKGRKRIYSVNWDSW